ncbi:hypothetical protein G7Y79_00048g084050 [Physcia stellaris]|nr:hypothetical protein G7Y79_00048g084050 [Physcia stellaris]
MGISLFSTLEAFGMAQPEASERMPNEKCASKEKKIGKFAKMTCGPSVSPRRVLMQMLQIWPFSKQGHEEKTSAFGAAAGQMDSAFQRTCGPGRPRGQQTAGFSKALLIDLGVAIGKREGFGATTGREAISAQDIDFFGVAIDEDSEKISEECVLSERSFTISGAGIERGMTFDDVAGEEVIDRGDEAGGFDSEADETTDSTGC